MDLKLGLNLGYWGIGPDGDDALAVTKAAEAAGFDSVWVAESYGSDVVSVLAWRRVDTRSLDEFDAVQLMRLVRQRRYRRGRRKRVVRFQAKVQPSHHSDPLVREVTQLTAIRRD